MPRDHARMNLAIWNDADFRSLPPYAQHLYMVLWTAPDLSYCGVTEWHPGKIAARASDWTRDDVTSAAITLIDRHFLVIDTDSEEALIRSWIRWDGLMGQPIMAVSMTTAFGKVASNTIRAVIVHELVKLRTRQPDLKGWSKPQVVDLLDQPTIDAKGLSNPLANPSVNPSLNPSVKGYGHPWAKGSVKTPSTPTPAPTPFTPAPGENADAAETGRAAAIVTDWINHCTNRPPRKVIGEVRSQIQDMLDDNISPERITAGLARWQQRGNLGPSLLPNLVHEVGNQPEIDDGPMLVLNEHMPRMEPTW